MICVFYKYNMDNMSSNIDIFKPKDFLKNKKGIIKQKESKYIIDDELIDLDDLKLNNSVEYKRKIIKLKDIFDRKFNEIYNDEIKKNLESYLKAFLNTDDVQITCLSFFDDGVSVESSQEIQIKNLTFKRVYAGRSTLGCQRLMGFSNITITDGDVLCDLSNKHGNMSISFSPDECYAKEFSDLYNRFQLNMETYMEKHYINWNINDIHTQKYFKSIKMDNPTVSKCAFVDIVSYIFTELMPSIQLNPSYYHDNKNFATNKHLYKSC